VKSSREILPRYLGNMRAVPGLPRVTTIAAGSRGTPLLVVAKLCSVPSFLFVAGLTQSSAKLKCTADDYQRFHFDRFAQGANLAKSSPTKNPTVPPTIPNPGTNKEQAKPTATVPIAAGGVADRNPITRTTET